MSWAHILLFFSPFIVFEVARFSSRARSRVSLALLRVRGRRAGAGFPRSAPSTSAEKWSRKTAELFLAGGSVKWK